MMIRILPQTLTYVDSVKGIITGHTRQAKNGKWNMHPSTTIMRRITKQVLQVWQRAKNGKLDPEPDAYSRDAQDVKMTGSGTRNLIRGWGHGQNMENGKQHAN